MESAEETWLEWEWSAEVAKPQTVGPLEGAGSEKRKWPVEGAWPELESVEGAWPGKMEGLAERLRPKKVGPVKGVGAERQWPEEGM